VKQIRLLPIVVFAALALLAFKTIGLVTQGGYVLVGTSTAVAAEGHDAAPASEQPADESSGDAPAAADAPVPDDPTMADDAPTLEDKDPTASMPESAPEVAEAGDTEAHDTAPTADNPAAAADPHAAPAAAKPDAAPAADTAGIPTPVTPVDQPVEIKDASGKPIGPQGDTTDAQILTSLSQRRDQLDALASQLDMRQSLVTAAEKRLDERTAELKAMEDRISALVDQKQNEEDAQFKSLVSMYENMKPADAATIFDTLDLPVLLRVSKAMNPRKMSPILAKMTPKIAQVLTEQLAAKDDLTALASPPTDTAAVLPQIVGH
jgi:flagellar motility protein MotE (MotC chaperone)